MPFDGFRHIPATVGSCCAGRRAGSGARAPSSRRRRGPRRWRRPGVPPPAAWPKPAPRHRGPRRPTVLRRAGRRPATPTGRRAPGRALGARRRGRRGRSRRRPVRRAGRRGEDLGGTAVQGGDGHGRGGGRVAEPDQRAGPAITRRQQHRRLDRRSCIGPTGQRGQPGGVGAEHAGDAVERPADRRDRHRRQEVAGRVGVAADPPFVSATAPPGPTTVTTAGSSPSRAATPARAPRRRGRRP